MLIRSVKLNNIRSYLDAQVDFPEGSTLLLGDIGSGKTTLLLALEFAFFGILKGDLPGTALLRHGASQGSVEVDLDVEGKRVVIRRVLKRGKNGVHQESGSIVIDGIRAEATAQELKSAILKLIGYPDELLTKSKNSIKLYGGFYEHHLQVYIFTDQHQKSECYATHESCQQTR